MAKYGLSFTLLSDPEHELASAYGVWTTKKNYGREYMGILRSTFLVDREGVVRRVWRGVRVNGHVSEVQAAAAELA
jgi:peroxiredoxin Q/BCP